MAKDNSKLIDYSKPLKNAKYERFCQEYIIDNNATQAAIRAKYSEKTAYSQGQRLLKNVEVAKRVAYLQSELSKVCGVTAKMLLEEWKKIAFANSQDYLQPSGALKSISDLTRDQAAAIQSITFNKQKNTKFTLHSKETALENIGKHIGFYEQDNKQKQAAPPTMVIHNPSKSEG